MHELGIALLRLLLLRRTQTFRDPQHHEEMQLSSGEMEEKETKGWGNNKKRQN